MTIPEPEAGSLPLTVRKEELYARARSLNHTPNEAARLAGYAAEHRNGPKVEKRRRVQARIAWLMRQPEEVLNIAREELAAFLWRVHRRRVTDFYETVEEPILDKEGNDTGEVKRRQRMRPFSDLTPEQETCVEGVRYTEGGPALSLYSAMQANVELRKLYGIGAVTKGEDDRSQMSLEALTGRIAETLRAVGLGIGEALKQGK